MKTMKWKIMKVRGRKQRVMRCVFCKDAPKLNDNCALCGGRGWATQNEIVAYLFTYVLNRFDEVQRDLNHIQRKLS